VSGLLLRDADLKVSDVFTKHTQGFCEIPPLSGIIRVVSILETCVIPSSEPRRDMEKTSPTW
jgi:hypothetical protein